jgi:hypothetical protein
MVITVSDDADALLELLWVRAALRLTPLGPDVPPPVSDLPSPEEPTDSPRSDGAAAERAWTELWDAVLHHLAEPADPSAFDALRRTPFGSDQRLALLTALRGPSWRDRFGDSAFDDAYQRWREVLAQRIERGRGRSLEEDPERRSLDALIGAWRRGLTTVVAIPCMGTHTRTVGKHGLLVTAETRGDPHRYSEALNRFGAP